MAGINKSLAAASAAHPTCSWRGRNAIWNAANAGSRKHQSRTAYQPGLRSSMIRAQECAAHVPSRNEETSGVTAAAMGLQPGQQRRSAARLAGVVFEGRSSRNLMSTQASITGR
jgi:hypothetical protein